MAYSPTRVANNILERAIKEGIEVTPMKLQKILYFLAAEYAKATGKPLLADEFKVWKYGPVSYPVYNEFMAFSRRPIDKLAVEADGFSWIVADPKVSETLDKIWPHVKDRTAVELSQITHMVGSAWYNAFQEYRPFIGQDEVMKDETYKVPLGMN